MGYFRAGVEETLTAVTGAGTDVALNRAGIRVVDNGQRGGCVAELRVEEKKRGAPWLLIFALLAVAVVIGWWLWSTRTSGEPTIDTLNNGGVVDTTRPAATPGVTQ